MDARIQFNVGVNFLLGQMRLACDEVGFALGPAWVDNDELILHLDQPDVKLYLQPTTFSSHPGFKVNKLIYKHLPAGSAILKVVMPWFSKLIERPLPMAVIKVNNNVIYIENMLSKDFTITAGRLTGDLYISLQ